MAKDILTDEDIEDLRAQFNEFDVDSNGHISSAELGHVLKAAGEDIPGYKLREMIAEIDRDKNGTIEFDEFMQMVKDMKSKKVSSMFGKAISKKAGISKITGKSTVSADGTTHSYSEEEKTAFVDYINSWLAGDEDCDKILPIDSLSHDIFSKVNDGILLCKMVNAAANGTIDERAINKKPTIYTKLENCTLALNSARSLGCNIVNLGAEDIMKGTEHLILGVLWQIIRIGLFSKIDLKEVPGLLNLLREGETVEDLQGLSPEELLIRWVNYHLEKAGSSRRIANFSGDIKDSEVYITLLRQICPNEIQLNSVPLTPDLQTRAQGMLENAELMDARAFVTPRDVVAGNSRLNTAFVANLFNLYPALEPVEDYEDLKIEETREEKTFRNWMNSLGVSPRVNYLYSDLCNGMVILQLEDMVKPGNVNWTKVNKPPFKQMGGKMKKIENCNYCVELGKGMKFSLVGIGGEDIHNGNQTLTLSIVWQLMRAYTLTILARCDQEGGGTVINDSQIVEWANAKVASSSEQPCTFTSFKDSSLSDSKFILMLIDAISPKAVNWENFVNKPTTEEMKMLNATYALSVARRAGASIYALPEDIVEVKPKMILTIFALLMALGLSRENRTK